MVLWVLDNAEQPDTGRLATRRTKQSASQPLASVTMETLKNSNTNITLNLILMKHFLRQTKWHSWLLVIKLLRASEDGILFGGIQPNLSYKGSCTWRVVPYDYGQYLLHNSIIHLPFLILWVDWLPWVLGQATERTSRDACKGFPRRELEINLLLFLEGIQCFEDDLHVRETGFPH